MKINHAIHNYFNVKYANSKIRLRILFNDTPKNMNIFIKISINSTLELRTHKKDQKKKATQLLSGPLANVGLNLYRTFYKGGIYHPNWNSSWHRSTGSMSTKCDWLQFVYSFIQRLL